MANASRPRVPVPEGGKVYSDRVVFEFGKMYSDVQKRMIPNRKSIGTPCNDGTGMMFPNQEYMAHFSDEYEKHTGMTALPDSISIGLYAAVSTIVTETGLRTCLESVFGQKRTNSILDYAMYVISSHSNVSEHYSFRMQANLFFSNSVQEDGYWSAFFGGITQKETDRFKELWAQMCAQKGHTKGYVSWDGSNNDCDGESMEFADSGEAKSETNDDIYGYMYCVGEDGTPVTYDAYDGATPDTTSIKNLIAFLHSLNIQIDGAIIDRGFDDSKYLDGLLTVVNDYVIKLKENTTGFINAAAEKGSIVRKYSYLLRIPNTRLCGDTVQSKLFEKSEKEDWVHIYYDFKNDGERAFTFLDQIDGAIETLQKQIEDYLEYEKKREEEIKKPPENLTKEKKKFSIAVPDKMKKFIKIEGTTAQNTVIKANEDAINEELLGEGFFAIGTHRKMTATEAHDRYQLRDNVKTIFDVTKTLLDLQGIRAASTQSLESRMLIAFVAAIIYTQLANVSKEIAKENHSTDPKYDTTVTIDNLLGIKMALLANGLYGLQYKSLSKVKKVYQKLNSPSDILKKTVETANSKFQEKKEAELVKMAKSKDETDASASDAANEESKPKRGRGRTPRLKDPDEEALPKRPVGRPPKPKALEEETLPKRPVGRPPKPKNPEEETQPKRPVGRPPKPKNPEEETQPKRPVGRPPLPKNPKGDNP